LNKDNLNISIPGKNLLFRSKGGEKTKKTYRSSGKGL